MRKDWLRNLIHTGGMREREEVDNSKFVSGCVTRR